MDQSPHDRMQEYEQLAEEEREKHAAKQAELDAVSDSLTAAVETAIETEGANAAVSSVSNDGAEQRLQARLDKAALVAAVWETLPEGFGIKRVNDDGTLTVEWDRRAADTEKRRAKTILTAIVSEELKTDADDFIISAPSRPQVIERATELGIDEEIAEDRLHRLVDLDVVDIEDGQVFPSGNFSQF